MLDAGNVRTARRVDREPAAHYAANEDTAKVLRDARWVSWPGGTQHSLGAKVSA